MDEYLCQAVQSAKLAQANHFDKNHGIYYLMKSTDLIDGSKTRENKLDVKVYDSTYVIPLTALRRIGLRLMTNDSPFLKKCWNTFFWIDYVTLVIVAWLELQYMVDKAFGGSYHDALDIFTMMPCFGCVLLGLSKSYKMARYRPVFENLIRELRAMWPTGSLSEQEHKVLKTAVRRLKIVVVGYYWCNNALLAFYLCRPFIGVIRRALGYDVPLTLPFFYALPKDPFQRGVYEVLLFSQTWHATLVIWCMYSGDVFFCIYLSHITSYFDLLSLRIRGLIAVPVDKQLIEEYPLGAGRSRFKFPNDLNNKAAEEIYERELKSLILRHQDLIRLSGDVEEMFSFPLLVNFFNSSIIICFCGFCCVMVEKWNEIVYKVFLATAISQTWLICWYGNRLIESSKSVADALYSSGWYVCSKRIRIPVLIMICRAQKIVRVTSYGFSTISLETFTTIMKSSWSYFTLLLHFYVKK